MKKTTHENSMDMETRISRMKKFFCAVAVMLLMAAGPAFADSMLSAPPMDSNDGLVFIGEETMEQAAAEDAGNGVLYVTLKRKMDKIWGPEAVKEKMAQDEAPGFADAASNLPKIVVAYRSKTGSSSYKYRHTYTSRYRSTGKATAKGVEYINITPVIVEEARKNNISPLLLKGVIQTESNFNNYAVSPAGAMGLGQIMPGTARYLGVKDAFNPYDNIRGAAKYLGMLKKMFKSTDLVLAAYNAGPGTVSRSGGVPNIYETRRYIVKVRKNMQW